MEQRRADKLNGSERAFWSVARFFLVRAEKRGFHRFEIFPDPVNGRHVRRPGGDRACAVASRPTLRGWPLAAKSP